MGNAAVKMDDVELVRENGVHVARFGNDVPTPERMHQGVMEQDVAVMGGRAVRVYREVNPLEIMRRNGTISEEMKAAGLRFQRDFGLAMLDAVQAVAYDKVGGTGGSMDLPPQCEAARRRVADALKAMGGMGSPCGVAAWWVLGLGCSIREMMDRQTGGGWKLNKDSASGIVVGTLGFLADFYGFCKKDARDLTARPT